LAENRIGGVKFFLAKCLPYKLAITIPRLVILSLFSSLFTNKFIRISPFREIEIFIFKVSF